MGTQAPVGPVPFDEDEYRSIGKNMARSYRIHCRELFGPADELDRRSWLAEFRAFRFVIAFSMCSLEDSDMARVNYCRHSLAPLATYHEVTTRLCRELDDCFHGAGERLDWARQVANVLELSEARERVCAAWKRDLAAGARAGVGGGT